MPKRDTYACICGECMAPIDREAVLLAFRRGLEYVHECGRVLARAR